MRSFLKRFALEDFARFVYHSGRKLGRRAVFMDRRILSAYLSGTASPKLHLGCGTHLLAGWLNSDFHPIAPGVFQLNATRPFPFADGVFDHIYSEHMIEHVPYRDGKNMLREAFRVLKPGGRIRISTPDMQFLFDLYSKHDGLPAKFVAWAAATEDPPTSVSVINTYVRAWGHQFIYDEATLRALLESSGFTGITRHEVSLSLDPAFRGLENTARMPEGFMAFESVVLEASKPS